MPVTKRNARRQPHRDVAIMMLVVEHGAIELEYRAGPEREIGAVGHYQPRGAVEPGANGFVAQQRVADTDPAGRRPGYADDFILDNGSFADARLCGKRTCRREGDCKKRRKEERVVT